MSSPAVLGPASYASGVFLVVAGSISATQSVSLTKPEKNQSSTYVQASVFVDVFRQGGEGGGARLWCGTASVPDLYNVLARFLGAAAADESFRDFAAARQRFLDGYWM